MADKNLDYEYNTTNWSISKEDPLVIRRNLMETLYEQTESSKMVPEIKKHSSFEIPFVNIEKKHDGEGEYAFDWFRGDEPFPESCCLVVYIHGGYWKIIELKEAGHWALPVVSNKSIFVSLAYRLAPHESIQNMSVNLCVGMQKVMELTLDKMHNLTNVEKMRICLVGHSVGVQLILDMLRVAQNNPYENQSWLSKVEYLVLISGLYDLRPILHTSINDFSKFESEEEAWNISPLKYLHDLNEIYKLKWLIAWADHDPPALIAQSKQAYHMLNERCGDGSKVNMFCAENEDHFTSIENLYFGEKRSKLFGTILDFINH